MKLVLSIISFLILQSAYPICELFYSSDIENWYKLRMVLYSTSFLFLYTSNNYKPTRLSTSSNTFFLGFIIEDLTDRLFYDITQFELNDLIAISISLGVAIYKYRNYDRN